MSTFTARLHLPGRAKLPLGVEIDIQHERMTLTSGDRTVAVLRLEDLDVTQQARRLPHDGRWRGRRPHCERAVPVRSRTGDQGAPAPDRGEAEATCRHSHVQRGVSPRFGTTHLATRQALRSDAVTPTQACARWLSLLKEINRRHGQGSMPAACSTG